MNDATWTKLYKNTHNFCHPLITFAYSLDPDQHCSGSELFVTLIVFLRQGLHRPGKVLEFYLGPGKLLEFEICPGIVLEFCKIILEKYQI